MNQIVISGKVVRIGEGENEFILKNKELSDQMGIVVSLNDNKVSINDLVFGNNASEVIVDGTLVHDGSKYKIVKAKIIKTVNEMKNNKKYRITESQLENLLENLSIFPDSNGKKITRHSIVKDSDGNRWRVVGFMDKGEVKCVGLDPSNKDKEVIGKSTNYVSENEVEESTTVASVGGGYDVPFPEIGTKVERKPPLYDGGKIVGENYLDNSDFLPDYAKKDNRDANQEEKRDTQILLVGVKNKLKEKLNKGGNISMELIALKNYTVKGVTVKGMVDAIKDNHPSKFIEYIGGLDNFDYNKAMEFNKLINSTPKI